MSVGDTGISETKLPAPVNKDALMRVMIFVDQSHSMKYLKCATDLDGATPEAEGPDCTPQPGVDPDKHRYEAINHWLQELITATGQSLDEPNVKVALIPFSGGATARARQGEDPALYKYLTLRQAQARLAELIQEQDQEPHYDVAAKKMGTTVPFSQLERAHSTVRAEMQFLEAAGILETASFEFIYMSDGVFKPLPPLLSKAKQLVGCPENCDGVNASLPGCQKNLPQGDMGVWHGETPFQFCTLTLPQLFTRVYGDVDENTVENVASSLFKTASLPELFSSGNMNVRTVVVHPDKVPVEDQVSPDVNLFNALQVSPDMAGLTNYFHYQLFSGDVPFALQPRLQGQVSYRIDKFFVINMNAYVNDRGLMVIDSDGDGLADDEEVAMNLDPLKARTNGKCADGIFKYYGCEKARPCSADMDEDGDGLNQCEEMTLSTDIRAADSDRDGLIDFFEVLRVGLNPNRDEGPQSKAGDGFNDQQHFARGVHPQVNLAQLHESMTVNYKIELSANNTEKTAWGNTVVVPTYRVEITNVPVVKTQSTMQYPAQNLHYMKAGVKTLIPGLDRIGPTPHEAGVNQIYFLVKVVAVEDPNISYWLTLRRDVAYTPVPVKISLRLEDLHQMQILR